MRYLTLHKANVLHKHPRVFAQLIWRDKKARVMVLASGPDSFNVTQDGSADIVLIPRSAVKPLPRKRKNKS